MKNDARKTKTRSIHVNAQVRTYAGQTARLLQVATTGTGRKLYALKTAGGTVATAWDTPEGLRAYGDEKRLIVCETTN